MNRSLRTVPAVVLAVAVIVLSIAGSATAAKLVTGKQIKNNSVASVDLKNNNVAGVDVKNQSLTGADVKAGSIGPSQLSAAAKNQVRFDEGDDQNIGTCADTALEDCSSIAITGLTPGTWLVTANLTIDNFSGPATSLSDRCGIYRAGSVLAEARTPLAADGAPGESEAISITQVVTATDSMTPVSLRCTEMGGESLRVGSPTISALRVA